MTCRTVARPPDITRLDDLTLGELAALEHREQTGTIRDDECEALTHARARLAPLAEGIAACASRLAFLGDAIAAGVAVARRRHAAAGPIGGRCDVRRRTPRGRRRAHRRRTGVTRAGPSDDGEPGEPARLARGWRT